MADDRLADAVMRLIREQNRLEEEKEYQDWHATLLTLPEGYKRELKEGWMADVELQPLRWMQLGLTLIQSPKVMQHVQLADGVQGPPLSSFLPYPVFQAGTEIFLKGMWLCRYEDCRLLGHNSLIGPSRRGEVFKELRSKLGHNLLQIIELLRGIQEYQADETSSDFLKATRALVCSDYFPAFQADVRGSEWASARYPKRFYNDEAGQTGADSFSHYPSQPFVERLFREALQGVDDLWGLHAGLAIHEMARLANRHFENTCTICHCQERCLTEREPRRFCRSFGTASATISPHEYFFGTNFLSKRRFSQALRLKNA